MLRKKSYPCSIYRPKGDISFHSKWWLLSSQNPWQQIRGSAVNNTIHQPTAYFQLWISSYISEDKKKWKKQKPHYPVCGTEFEIIKILADKIRYDASEEVNRKPYENIPEWIRHNAILFPYYGTTAMFSDFSPFSPLSALAIYKAKHHPL